MKTANRHLILAASFLLGVSVNSTSALADPPSSAAVSSPVMPSSVTPPAISAQPSEIATPSLPKPMSGDKKDAKNTDTADVKVPDSVKDVIKRLNAKNEDITLDDLNAAREAVAKLDALIDIEKRLSDLDKIREDREKDDDKKFAEAIPLKTLQPPPIYALPAVSTPPAQKKSETKESQFVAPAPPAEIDIVSIEGSNNHYGAIVRDNGSLRMVHAGDHMSDGSVILSVTTQGVELERNKITHLAQVRDVQGVFGNSP